MRILSGEEQLELVRAARKGDQGAYTSLYELMDSLMRRTLYRIVPESDLDDVIQDAMLRAFLKLDQFKEDAKFTTWCMRIGINAALMCRRKAQIEARSVVASLDSTTTNDEGYEYQVEVGYDDRTFDQRIASETIERALTMLPDDQRLAIEMQLDGHSIADICLVTGSPVSTVKATLHRGKANLADVIKGTRTEPVRKLRRRKPAQIEELAVA